MLILQVRRFACDSSTCPRRIFCERLPTLTLPYARRTTRFTTVLRDLAFALGGRPSVRFAAQHIIRVSRRTLLRLIRAAPVPAYPPPTRIGVDDFALRKGHVYGTVIIDLDTHRPIDLLPDRTTLTFAAWLSAHPGITVVRRDRASAYADAATQSAPGAIQVADRFHLLKNMTETVAQFFLRKRVFALTIADTPPVPPVAAHNTPPPVSPSRTPAGHKTTKEHREQAERRARRLARYTQVMALHHQGFGVRAIARLVSIHPTTVTRYVKTSAFPEHAPRSPRTVLTPYEDYIRQRWQEAQPTITQLWQEIRTQGYRGSYRSIQTFLAPLRPYKQWGSGDPSRRPVLAPEDLPPTVRQKKVTTRAATWALMPAETAETAPLVAALKAWDTEVDVVQHLVQQFQTLLHRTGTLSLADWLRAARESAIPEFGSFARGVQLDIAAVSAACTRPESNGPTEGQVNRIKTIKRQMYGRATFALLKARVLAA